MTLLAPWALWFSAVGLAVVALYLLKIKRRRQAVPALDFWRELGGRTQVRSLFQRLKRWLSLLLWLVIIACLIMAVGNPILSFGRIKPRSIAVIVDNSASMQALEGETEPKTRLRLAKQAVEDFTTRRPVNDEWMLIEAGRQPRVLRAWTRDRKAIRDAAGSINPGSGAVDLAAAVELASQLLEGKERPCILLVSDGAAGQAEELAERYESVIRWPIGKADDNLGITRLSVRPHRQEAAHYAYVALVNASSEDVETQVVLELDGSTTAVEPVTVAAGATWEKTVVLSAPQGGVLRAWIDRPDVLAADDEAYAILEPIEPAAVLLVSPSDGAFFFEQALLAMEPLIDLDASLTLTIEEYDALPPTVDTPDLTIFNNCVPATLPAAGGFVFVNGWPAGISAKAVGVLEQPELFIAPIDHPLLRYLNLSAATLIQAKRVDLAGEATVLARSAGGDPLIFLHEQPDRQALCLAFDVLESDLPFRNAFPLLLRNAVAYLGTERARWVRDQYAIGDVIEPLRPLPTDVREVGVAKLRDDEIKEQAIAVLGGSFLFPAVGECGPLRFTIGDDTAYTAINLTEERESRIGVAPLEENPEKTLALSDPLFGTVPWLALAACAALLIGAEWLTYHFRWTE